MLIDRTVGKLFFFNGDNHISCYFYFLNQETSFVNQFPSPKSHMHIENIHLEGNFSDLYIYVLVPISQNLENNHEKRIKVFLFLEIEIKLGII